MARARTGQAISPARRTPEELDRLNTLLKEAESAGDIDVWRRARGVLSYIEGTRVAEIAQNLKVVRGSVNQWLRWFELAGVQGLRGSKAPGPAPKLTSAQQEELGALIDAGPQACGYQSGVWTGPMIGELIRTRFGVSYHNHHVPRLLHQLGFSVQRPSKRLARADLEAQAVWIRETYPEIKKKPPTSGES
jgi:transposase